MKGQSRWFYGPGGQKGGWSDLWTKSLRTTLNRPQIYNLQETRTRIRGVDEEVDVKGDQLE